MPGFRGKETDRLPFLKNNKEAREAAWGGYGKEKKLCYHLFCCLQTFLDWSRNLPLRLEQGCKQFERFCSSAAVLRKWSSEDSGILSWSLFLKIVFILITKRHLPFFFLKKKSLLCCLWWDAKASVNKPSAQQHTGDWANAWASSLLSSSLSAFYTHTFT